MATDEQINLDDHFFLTRYYEILAERVMEYLMEILKEQTFSVMDLPNNNNCKQKAIITNNRMIEILKLKFRGYMVNCVENCIMEKKAFREWSKGIWNDIFEQRELVGIMITRTNQRQVQRLIRKIAKHMRRLEDSILDMDCNLLLTTPTMKQK
jgi:hypothetical protein